MLKLITVLFLFVFVYNFSECGLASPRVANDGPGGIEQNGRSFYKGHRRPSYTGFIINGQRAKKSQFPYQVRIINSNKEYFFGGAIISRKHVLTTASVINALSGSCSPQNLKVQAGMVNLNEKYNIKIFQAQETICHRKYDSKNLINNIAIIKIKKIFNYTPHVKAVKISWIFHAAYLPVTISGWGRSSSGQYSDVLLYGETYSVCTWDCLQLEPRFAKYMHPTKGCVHSYSTGGPHGTYNDMGGPVVHNGKLIGLVCYFNWDPPTVEAIIKVAYYRKWIEDIVGKKRVVPIYDL